MKDQVEKLLNEIPPYVKLIAVSKTHPAEEIREAYNLGLRDFGENKVQEMIAKQPLLPNDIKWHLIGHLQTNKVKFIAPFVYMIHSVDSLKLLHEVNQQAARNSRVIDCLLQIYIASEDTKFGLDFNEAEELLSSKEFAEMQNIRIKGLMGMATFTDDAKQVHREFKSLKAFFDKLKQTSFADKDYFTEISMGMSSDYTIAIEEGSTMVRIGTVIFGKRNYPQQ